MNIKWEEHGSGEPLLLIQGLGYGRWGWDPVVPGLAERVVRAGVSRHWRP